MAINEEHRQVEIASEAETLLRSLAHSTRSVPAPEDSYALLGELTAITSHLWQVCEQLARWHAATARPAAVNAASDLRDAADSMSVASSAVARAHSANGAIRWS